MTRRRGQPKRPCIRCDQVKTIEGRGLCNLCWQHLRYHGQLDQYPRESKSPQEWFDLADKSDPSACWIWPGPRNPQSGYGNVSGQTTAHRWAYERHVGPIPPGAHVDHVCHSRSSTCPGGPHCPHRPCFNPAHLEVVELGENVLRGSERHALCQREHPVAPDATRHWECGECRRAGRRQAWAKNADEINRQRRERYAERRRQGTK